MFARRLPDGRRYGVVAGTGRLLDALADFRFGDEELAAVGEFLDGETLQWLADYRFTGDIDGYREGELYFPGSPILTVRASFADAVVLETLILSILNHDSAIASAAARMVTAAASRPIIEMGSRRTHEYAAVASSRAAYLAGVTATSNLEAARSYGVPSAGTAAHAFTLLFTDENGPNELAAFRTQVERLGLGTTLLVDTYDITRGVANAIEAAGPELGAVRIDSGDLGILARQVREQLDSLGAHRTKIVVSGDLDEYAIASLRAEPVDIYGVGTSLVTGSGGADSGNGLQARRDRRHPGREALEPQGVARRRQGGGPHRAAQRHGHRRSAVPVGRTGTGRRRSHHHRPPDSAGARRRPRRRASVIARRARSPARRPHHAAVGGLGLSHGEPAIPTRHAF